MRQHIQNFHTGVETATHTCKICLPRWCLSFLICRSSAALLHADTAASLTWSLMSFIALISSSVPHFCQRRSRNHLDLHSSTGKEKKATYMYKDKSILLNCHYGFCISSVLIGSLNSRYQLIFQILMTHPLKINVEDVQLITLKNQVKCRSYG